MSDIDRQFTAELDVYEMDDSGCLEKTGTKIVGPPERPVLNKWASKPRAVVLCAPLKAAISTSGACRCDRLAEGAVGYLGSNSSDVQNSAQMVSLLSSAWGRGHGWSVTPDNFRKSMAIFAVRKAVKKTWLNDRDQFTIPAEEPSDEFYNDCLVYALFHGSNQTSSLKDVEYKGQVYQVRNQFFPYHPQDFLELITEPQWYNQLSKAKPVFVGQYLKDCQLSPEAQQLLDNGHLVYQHFYHNLPRLDRQQYRLDYWDAGWYQVRKSLELAGLAGPELQAVRDAHRQLEAKITPQVYSLGFLRP